MWYKVKRIYQWTNLVRPVEPVEITEPYTLSTASYNADLFEKVAKSWYKIKEINIKWQCENYNPWVEWYSATYAWLAIGQTDPRFIFDVSHGTYHDRKGKIQYSIDWQRQELYATSDSPISVNSWNTCECTFTREWFNFSINWHQYSWSYSSWMIDKITQIMDDSNATIFLNTIRWYVRDYTYTITYISS